MSGHYVYAEANEGSKGDNASIISPEFTSGVDQSILFYYHMYSNSPYDTKPGTLKVIVFTVQLRYCINRWTSWGVIVN